MRVVIAESPEYSERGLTLFAGKGWEVEIFSGELADLPGALADADGAIVRFGLHWDDALIRKAAPLKFLAVPATGTDHIDAAAADAAGIRIVSLAGDPGLKEITATPEHAFGLMLAVMRNTVAAHRSVMDREWNRDAFFGRQLRGKTVGIIGMGRTGTAFAVMSQAFGMDVVYYDPYVESGSGRRCEDLAELAAQSDVVAVHAVLNDETRGMLGDSFFSQLKPGAFFVNTARGAIVNEDGLLQALSQRLLAGAAVDVICDEPGKGQAVESRLVAYAKENRNVIITPHIGGATAESIETAEYLLAVKLVEQDADPA